MYVCMYLSIRMYLDRQIHIYMHMFKGLKYWHFLQLSNSELEGSKLRAKKNFEKSKFPGVNYK
jgi:hypothetical protein